MMEDALFSLADDLPDELEKAVTSGDQSYNNVGDNESSVSQLQYSECPQCHKLRQELNKAHNDHNVNYNMLKEKIIQTDLLIKRYNAKCQECDNKAKMVDAITLKLEEVKRDCDTLAANLKSALEEGEPLRKAKEKLEKQKENLTRQLRELENKVQALEVTNEQLQSAQETNASKAEKNINKTRIKELEASLKKSAATVKKYQDELAARKQEIHEYKQNLQKKNTEQNKLQKKILHYEALLSKYGLLDSPTGCQSAVKQTCLSDNATQSCQSPVISDNMPTDPESPAGGITVDEIFHEMGVYDVNKMIVGLSPAVSPIPPSPAPVKNVRSRSNSTDTSSESVSSDGSDIESVADLLEDKLMSSDNEAGSCHGNSKEQILQRQLSVLESAEDDEDDDGDDDGGDDGIPFTDMESQEAEDPVTEDVCAMSDGGHELMANQPLDGGKHVTEPSSHVTEMEDHVTAVSNDVTKAKDPGMEECVLVAKAEPAAEVNTVSAVCEESSKLNDGQQERDETSSASLLTPQGSADSLSQPAVVKPAKRSRSLSASQTLVPLRRSPRIKRLSEGDESINSQPVSKTQLLQLKESAPSSETTRAHDECKSCDTAVKRELLGDAVRESHDEDVTIRLQDGNVTSPNTNIDNLCDVCPGKGEEESKSVINSSQKDSQSDADTTQYVMQRDLAKQTETNVNDKSSSVSVTTDETKDSSSSESSLPITETSNVDAESKNNTGVLVDDSLQKDVHPALPKQSSTGFEVLASEDLFSDSSSSCSPNPDSSPFCHSLMKEHRPWTFPVPNKARSPKSRSPVRFMIGDNPLIPCQSSRMESSKVDEAGTNTAETITLSQLPDIKEDDSESVSSFTFSMFPELPSPISPLSDFGSSSELAAGAEDNLSAVDSSMKGLAENNNNNICAVSLSNEDKHVFVPIVSAGSGTNYSQASRAVDVTLSTQPTAGDRNINQRSLNCDDRISEPDTKTDARTFKRKLTKSASALTTQARHSSSSGAAGTVNSVTGSAAVDPSADAVIPRKRKKKDKDQLDNSNNSAFAKVTLTKQQRKIIETEMDLMLNCVAMTTQQIVDRLHSTGVALKGVVDVIINRTISSSNDMLTTWHKRCLSDDINSTPWLSDTEQKYVDLIKCLDATERSVMSYFLTRVKTTLTSNKLRVPAPVYPALCCMYVALCRSVDQLERCRVFVYDVVYMKINLYSAIITAVAVVWPQVLRKHQTDASPVIAVLEYILLVKTLHSGKPRHSMMTSILCKLCNWEKPSTDRDTLTNQLLARLMSAAKTKQSEVFECERALDLLACHEDWVWTNDVLVRKHLWPVLQQWSSGKDNETLDGLIQSVLRLVGYLMSHCPADKADITRHMMTTFVTLLQQSEQVSRQIQIVSIHALVRLSPYDPGCTTSCLQSWINDKSKRDLISEEDLLLIENCLKHYKH